MYACSPRSHSDQACDAPNIIVRCNIVPPNSILHRAVPCAVALAPHRSLRAPHFFGVNAMPVII